MGHFEDPGVYIYIYRRISGVFLIEPHLKHLSLCKAMLPGPELVDQVLQRLGFRSEEARRELWSLRSQGNKVLPSGKHTKNDGKPQFFTGKSTINGYFQ